MQVTGIDIAPKMVQLAQERVKGSFQVADLLEYEPETALDGVFIIYAQLSLSYASVHAMAFKYAKALQPGGLMVVGQTPADVHVKPEDPAWDKSGAYVEDFSKSWLSSPLSNTSDIAMLDQIFRSGANRSTLLCSAGLAKLSSCAPWVLR